MARARATTTKTKKPTGTVVPKPTKPPRILKKSTCPTLSGKSTLTYNIAVDKDGGILLRVISNSGGGFFSTEWVDLADIQQALDGQSPITSISLMQLFRGKSANNAGFLLAVLRAEKLIQPMPGNSVARN